MSPDALPTLPPDLGPAESVTADERRRWLEAIAFQPASHGNLLDPMVLGSVGLSAVDPAGERFEGECEALVAIISERSTPHAFAVRVFALTAIEIWATTQAGTVASRAALLRAASAFLLHDAATRGALLVRTDAPQDSGG